jgi:hypothetical protein
MKTPHNIKKGETKTFKHLGELNDFAEKHHYKNGEFEFVNTDPLTIEKVC